MSRDCCGVSGLCVIGAMRPCTLIEGATPAVMNKSEAFLWTINLRNEVKSTALMALSEGESAHPHLKISLFFA